MATTLISDAVDILGLDVHGTLETKAHLGYQPTETEMAEAVDVPFSAAVLEGCRSTHLLVWLAPLSVIDIWLTHRRLLDRDEDSWYDDQQEEFALTKAKPGWHLIRKGLVPGSLNRTWEEQQLLLSATEEVPSSAVVVQASLLRLLERGEQLLDGRYARTSDEAADGQIVDVGWLKGRFSISCGSGDKDGIIGIASSQKTD